MSVGRFEHLLQLLGTSVKPCVCVCGFLLGPFLRSHLKKFREFGAQRTPTHRSDGKDLFQIIDTQSLINGLEPVGSALQEGHTVGRIEPLAFLVRSRSSDLGASCGHRPMSGGCATWGLTFFISRQWASFYPSLWGF